MTTSVPPENDDPPTFTLKNTSTSHTSAIGNPSSKRQLITKMTESVPTRDLSIFERAWNQLDPQRANRIPLNMTPNLIQLIENELMGTENDSGFLYKDELIQIDTDRIIKDLEIELHHPKDKIHVPKQYMYHIVSEVLSNLKIFDYDSIQWYGNKEFDHMAYQDNFNHLLTKKQSIDSFMVIDSSDDEFDFDETSSLMETGAASFESPSSHINFHSPSGKTEDTSDSMSKPIHKERVQIFQLKKSLEDLQKFHSTLDDKFQVCEMEIQQLQDQNNHDFKNLMNLNKQHSKMSSRIGTIRSQLMTCSIQLHEIDPNVTPSTFDHSYTTSHPPDLTETIFLDIDIQLINKLALKTPQNKGQYDQIDSLDEIELKDPHFIIPIIDQEMIKKKKDKDIQVPHSDHKREIDEETTHRLEIAGTLALNVLTEIIDKESHTQGLIFNKDNQTESSTIISTHSDQDSDVLNIVLVRIPLKETFEPIGEYGTHMDNEPSLIINGTHIDNDPFLIINGSSDKTLKDSTEYDDSQHNSLIKDSLFKQELQDNSINLSTAIFVILAIFVVLIAFLLQ